MSFRVHHLITRPFPDLYGTHPRNQGDNPEAFSNTPAVACVDVIFAGALCGAIDVESLRPNKERALMGGVSPSHGGWR
jgi:hypothetical protein